MTVRGAGLGPRGRVPCRCGVLVQMVITDTGSLLPLDLRPSVLGRWRPVGDRVRVGGVLAEWVLTGHEQVGEPLWACHYATCTAAPSLVPRLPVSQRVCPSCGEAMAAALEAIGLGVHPTCPQPVALPEVVTADPPLLDLAS